MSGIDFEHRLPLSLVLLLHECPGKPPHVDWLIAGDVSGHKPLKSFRIDDRLDRMLTGSRQTVTPMEDHRPRYLHCDGPLSGGRGTVRRLARGRLWTSIESGTCKIIWRTGPATGQTQWIRFSIDGLEVCCEGWNGDPA